MKKVLAVLLVAALLTGCGAGDSKGEVLGVVSTAENSTIVETTESAVTESSTTTYVETEPKESTRSRSQMMRYIYDTISLFEEYEYSYIDLTDANYEISYCRSIIETYNDETDYETLKKQWEKTADICLDYYGKDSYESVMFWYGIMTYAGTAIEDKSDESLELYCDRFESIMTVFDFFVNTKSRGIDHMDANYNGELTTTEMLERMLTLLNGYEKILNKDFEE